MSRLHRLGFTASWSIVALSSCFGCGGGTRVAAPEEACPCASAHPAAVSVNDMSWTERRAYFAERLEATGCGIDPKLDLTAIIDGLAGCVAKHKERLTPELLSSHPDEPFAIASVEEAIAAVRSKPREFGIGAVLVKGDAIIERAHNTQLGANRSDLHAEMTLLTQYEERTKSTRGSITYGEGLRVYSSTEPCPMCLTRLVIAGIPTYYAAASDEDGMAHIKDRLPPSWASSARKVPTGPAKSSEKIGAIALALFYSYTRFEAFADLK